MRLMFLGVDDKAIFYIIQEKLLNKKRNRES